MTSNYQIVAGAGIGVAMKSMMETGDAPDCLKTCITETKGYGKTVSSVLKDPVILAEGMAQSASDTVEEKGIAYSTSYVLGGVLLTKGLNKVSSVSKAGEVVDVEKNVLKVDKGVSDTDIIKSVGLDKVKMDEIVSMSKGSRPQPSTYLSNDYMQLHLKQFENGGSFVMTKQQYMRFVEGNPYIGCPDNTQFIAPKDFMDKIDNTAKGDISVYEKKLGFDDGHFSSQGGLVRFDIKNPNDINLRIPSGNELGANEHWIPGGYTDGGTAEAITDSIPNNIDSVDIKFFK
ncbi:MULTISPECIES: hypothetical protein [Clostridium]|uniref:Uncharacterized protein n=1 Tax=Clostridium frigoriphilum TaxID=443253 RepID=A0ABU7UWS0_9CLOT|nr:hypothetical protein [Clostridium sp. DSM 17811]MBU3102433.1 hypothetical protein [Clostridium sp. DSM 17811]